MGTSKVDMQSFVAYKMRPKCLIKDLINDVRYLYVNY